MIADTVLYTTPGTIPIQKPFRRLCSFLATCLPVHVKLIPMMNLRWYFNSIKVVFVAVLSSVYVCVYVVGSLLGSGLGHCCYCVIWPILWAAVEFCWGSSVFHHSYNCTSCPVICNILRVVPCPARSRSVVWEPSSWLGDIYCSGDCCGETNGGRCNAICISIWETTQTTSAT